MKIIQYMDNDEINKPQAGNSPVYSLDSIPEMLIVMDLTRTYERSLKQHLYSALHQTSQ